MRNLHHYSGAVAGLVVGTLSPAVCHVFKHRQTLVNDIMMLAAIYFHYQAYATAIMFVIR